MDNSLTDEERRMVSVAIRGWLEIGFSEKEKKLLALSLLMLGKHAEDMEATVNLAAKLGIGDVLEEVAKEIALEMKKGK